MKKVASVLVSWDGFRDPGAQAARRHFAVDIAQYCRRQRAEVVLLPAGYLLAKGDTEATARREAEALARSFKDMSLAAGIDSLAAEQLKRSKAKSGELLDKWTRRGTLPFWVFASDPAGNVLDMFRQRSTTSHNAGLMPSGAAHQNRTLQLAGLHTYLLACGELFSPFIRQSLGSQQGIGLIAHLAHGGLGRNFRTTFPQLANATGAWIINAQHTSTGRCWAAGSRGPAREAPGTLIRPSASSSGLWARIALWNIP